MKECLRLENQLCFPLYVASKDVIRKYKPFLDEIDLTYTQYITMMVLWDEKEVNVKELGSKLYLDSGTLTPLLKNLEVKGYIKRVRSSNDERNLLVSLTDKGVKLENKAASIPSRIGKCIDLTKEEAVQLYSLLYKVIGK